jgi:hypothetical protein
VKIIKNSEGKTICRIDAKNKVIEIKSKGIITTIRFLDDGTIEVTNKAA